MPSKRELLEEIISILWEYLPSIKHKTLLEVRASMKKHILWENLNEDN